MNTDKLLKETTRRPWAVCGGATPKFIAIKHKTGYVVFGMADHTEDREGGKAISAPPFAQQRANARLIVRAVNAFEPMRKALNKNSRFGPGWKGGVTVPQCMLEGTVEMRPVIWRYIRTLEAAIDAAEIRARAALKLAEGE